MKSIGVYLGAQVGNNPIFSESVNILGKTIANLGYSLVYGGSSLGLMGQLANTVLDNGGQVIGITTKQLLEKEQAMRTLNELHIVDSMQARKQMIQQRSDMFIVMPGGLGTLEEAFETWNAVKVGLIDKPIGFFNTAGYFDNLFSFIRTCKENGFISESQLKIPFINTDIQVLVEDMHKAIQDQTQSHTIEKTTN